MGVIENLNVLWIPLLPLLGGLVNAALYAVQVSRKNFKVSAGWAGGLATACLAGSFLAACHVFFELQGLSAADRRVSFPLWDWIWIPEWTQSLELIVDPLSIVFIGVITGVGIWIHLYSISYMKEDASPGKFFAYLNFFCFAMLILVMANCLPLLFFGWEGVGLCSYWLIGYWYTDSEKAAAGKKAFLFNRVGDLGFLLGMWLLFQAFTTLDFQELQTSFITLKDTLSPPVLTFAGLAFFFACTGKSAQIPLYLWLPDAMAGPTPVSALIHAATMVTSGVYLLARLHFLFDALPEVLNLIAWVGGITAFWAACLAVVQEDIKKVLAYSTVSQLGYLFMACGVGAYDSAVFHVVTHAFFKALLFLAAGSVIHALHEEQNILKMGGLRHALPRTFAVFGIGGLAIIGCPPFAGFFSKDEILWRVGLAALHTQEVSLGIWLLGLGTALLTAFYLTRLGVLTFLGAGRGSVRHPHEAPFLMQVALMVLAGGSVLGGVLNLPGLHSLSDWLVPVLGKGPEESLEHAGQWELLAMGLNTLLVLGGVGLAFRIYRDLEFARAWKQRLKLLHGFLIKKGFLDEGVHWIVVKPLQGLAQLCWIVGEQLFLKQLVGLAPRLANLGGRWMRRVQDGSLQTGLFLMGLGVLGLFAYFTYGRIYGGI